MMCIEDGGAQLVIFSNSHTNTETISAQTRKPFQLYKKSLKRERERARAANQ